MSIRLYAINEQTKELYICKTVCDAVELTGVSNPSVKKYLDKDKYFKGWKFTTKRVKWLKTKWGQRYYLDSMDEGQKDLVIAMWECTLPANSKDIDRILTIATLPENRRYAFSRELYAAADDPEAMLELDYKLGLSKNPEDAHLLREKMIREASKPCKSSSGRRFDGTKETKFWEEKND